MKTIKIEISETTKKSFFQAISILIEKPQVVNRKLSCSVNKFFAQINVGKEEFLTKISIQEIGNFGENLKQYFDEKIPSLYEVGSLQDLQHADELDGKILFLFDKNLPRNLKKFPEPCYSISIISKSKIT